MIRNWTKRGQHFHAQSICGTPKNQTTICMCARTKQMWEREGEGEVNISKLKACVELKKNKLL